MALEDSLDQVSPDRKDLLALGLLGHKALPGLRGLSVSLGLREILDLVVAKDSLDRKATSVLRVAKEFKESLDSLDHKELRALSVSLGLRDHKV